MLLAKPIHAFGRWYIRRLCRVEHAHQSFVRFNERPPEYRFIFDCLSRMDVLTILDVGTGTTPLPAMMRACGFLVTALDNVRDYWPAQVLNRHYHVIDQDIQTSSLSQSFDFITCVSVLEHIRNHRAAMQSMFRLLRPGGYVALTVPYCEKEYIANVYELPESTGYGANNKAITQVFSRAEIQLWLEDNPADLFSQEFWRTYTGRFNCCGKELRPAEFATIDTDHDLGCFVLRRRL